jgi:hypothetical protein
MGVQTVLSLMGVQTVLSTVSETCDSTAHRFYSKVTATLEMLVT